MLLQEATIDFRCQFRCAGIEPQDASFGKRTTVDARNPFGLVQAFGDRVYSLAKHLTQDEAAAEDVLIQTFLKHCPDPDGRHEDEQVWLRLVTTVVREAFSHLYDRSEGLWLADSVADSPEDLVVREYYVWGDNYQQRYSPEQTTRLLDDGLRSLDPMCRTVFVLRDMEEIPVEQIARILGRSVAAVGVCLLRARLQLREILTRQMRQQ